VVAQAAATAASLFEGRFFLGVGTGENLNEHILGERWPPTDVRRQMLEEAVDVMRELWRGGLVSHRGTYFTVENARLYTLPDDPFDIYVAAGGPEAAQLAAQIGDGLIATSADRDLLAAFEGAGGGGHRYGQVTVCWAGSEAAARKTALRWWPNAGLRGTLSQELPLPSHFEQAAEMVSEEDIAAVVACGPDPALHLAKIRECLDAGFDHVYIHQVGPDQEGFFKFYEQALMPKLDQLRAAATR
jgi:G6PDH family F420-dependent oxidoreductase